MHESGEWKGGSGVLPVSFHGVSKTVTTGISGETYAATYQCQKGEWVYQGSTGICGQCTDSLYAKKDKKYACWGWYLGPGEAWSGNALTVAQGLLVRQEIFLIRIHLSRLPDRRRMRFRHIMHAVAR